MTMFVFCGSPNSMARTTDESEVRWFVPYYGRDTDPNNEVEVGNNAEVLIVSTDTGPDIEVKIRDAVVADIYNTVAIVVDPANVFQHAMRRN